jgi:peptidyl-prolyl cis-trans isomerase B (cyclophilin B)
MKTLAFLPLLALLVGCNSSDSAAKSDLKTDSLQSTYKTPEAAPLEEPNFDNPKDGEEVAVVSTKFGNIVFKFRPDLAPKHVENFKKLANKGFYDKTIFHRVIPDFMIQGGDPNTKDPAKTATYGAGGPGYMVKAEFNNLDHKRGVVSMARSQDVNSAGSQFFIVTKDHPDLNNQYTAFGVVVSGMDIADKIVAQPRGTNDLPNERIEMTVKIAKWPVK